MSGFVNNRVAELESKKKQREERFRREASKPPPPKPKRTFAHPGGKITHNKEAALAAFLKRKGGKLTAQQQASLKNLEKIGQYKGPQASVNTVEATSAREKGPEKKTVAESTASKNASKPETYNKLKPKTKNSQTKKVQAQVQNDSWRNGKYKSKRFSKQRAPGASDSNQNKRRNGGHYRPPYSRSGRRVSSGHPKFQKGKRDRQRDATTGIWRSVNTTNSKLREAGETVHRHKNLEPKHQDEHSWKAWSVPKKSWTTNA